MPGLVGFHLWTPFLYADRLAPSSSHSVNYLEPVPFPQVAGITLYPQIVLALIAVALIAGGYELTRLGNAGIR